ncbi:CidA/LrgA family protein [Paraburkholderia sp. D15]|uniref:CidA/LrgA family protein n=1 Tax=Paraburkholderia sp. D15 TaxID=2880218 RepID=UPI0024797ED8|nr:CidA/LrgA family protein [Paraburkholderia sp. D15]WGS51162.1 CidA/LrgA family protein [Paraburkholderia sp. D15]WKF59107.1 Holin-like protein CidA [Paraburkholderia busanensis]
MFGFAFYIAMYLVGNYLSTRFALPVPGAIIGLGLVFAMLSARGRIDAPLKASSDTLLRYLALMLVPTCVGVVKLIHSVPPGILSLIVVLVLALVAGCLAVAWIANALLGRRHAAARAVTP